MGTQILKILPLGGFGEIGINCLCLEWKGERVLIDCGIQFPDASYSGVDLLTPDFRPLKDDFSKLKGIVITHGHDDHIGAIPFLAKDTEVDVYCTPFPEGLIRQKLGDIPDTREIRFHEITPREIFRVGPFQFDPIPVQHSIIEALGLAVKTPVGTIIHSGDFKHDPNELVPGKKIGFDPFREYGEKGVRLLFSDSTNAERDGHTLSELDIAESFSRILARQNSRLFIALFASNIRRIEKILSVAKKNGKVVALAGRSMHSYIRLAFDQNSLKIPEDTLVLAENIDRYPDKNVIVLLTGSQAEPQSALLRVALGEHNTLKIRPGDEVILSSRFIPGNERAIAQMIDHLYRQGAQVTYESFHQIHVSGHGFQDELLMMIDAVRPEYFIPLHGEYRHLAKHAQLAKRWGLASDKALVVEDGQIIEIDKHGVRLGERIPLLKGVVVGGTFFDSQLETFQQRIKLSRTGVVVVVLVVHKRSWKLARRPKIAAHALLYRHDVNPKKILDAAIDHIEDVYSDILRQKKFEEALTIEIRRFFKKKVSHRPLVIPVVIET